MGISKKMDRQLNDRRNRGISPQFKFLVAVNSRPTGPAPTHHPFKNSEYV